MEEIIRELSTRLYGSSGMHPLDSLRVEHYLKTIKDETYRKLVQYILDHTIYLTMDELITGTRRLLSLVLEKIKDPFYILLPTKIGSEWWFTAKVYDLYSIHPCFGGFVTQVDLIKSGHVIIIDDAIYSGFNMIEIFDNLDENLPLEDLTFHIITPVSTTTGEANIRSAYTCKKMKLNFYYERLFRPLMHLIPHSGYDDNFLSIPDTSYASTLPLDLQPIFNRTRIDFMDIYSAVPVYFDHKVANGYGSFPELYLHGYLDPKGENKFGTILTSQCDRSMLYGLPESVTVQKRKRTSLNVRTVRTVYVI